MARRCCSARTGRWPDFDRCAYSDADTCSGRGSRADYLPQLQQELVAVISKYVSIRPEDIKVNLDRQENYEVLEVKIELPEGVVR